MRTDTQKHGSALTEKVDKVEMKEIIIEVPDRFGQELKPEIVNSEIKGELVRCKDCKYSEHWYKDKCRCFLWHESGIDVFNDVFCNYGKRKQT